MAFQDRFSGMVSRTFFRDIILGTGTLTIAAGAYRNQRQSTIIQKRAERQSQFTALTSKEISPYVFASLRKSSGAKDKQILLELNSWAELGTLTKDKAKFLNAHNKLKLKYDQKDDDVFIAFEKVSESELTNRPRGGVSSPFASAMLSFASTNSPPIPKPKREGTFYQVLSYKELKETEKYFQERARKIVMGELEEDKQPIQPEKPWFPVLFTIFAVILYVKAKKR